MEARRDTRDLRAMDKEQCADSGTAFPVALDRSICESHNISVGQCSISVEKECILGCRFHSHSHLDGKI